MFARELNHMRINISGWNGMGMKFAMGCLLLCQLAVAQTAPPSISFLSPTIAPAGSPDTLLTVTGSGFVNGARVLWNGTALQNISFKSSTQITATISQALLATSGYFPVTVANTPGNPSFASYFSVPPAISGLNGLVPSFVQTGSGDVTLTVNGFGFVTAQPYPSVLYWTPRDSQTRIALQTTVQSSTRLTAIVRANLLTTAGFATVSVFNSLGDGGLSSAEFLFGVLSPIVLRPDNAPAGSPDTPMTITGTGFLNPVVTWTNANGQITNLPVSQSPTPTSTTVVVTIPKALLLNVGTAQVQVVPGESFTISSATASLFATFTITGSPTITRLDPNSAAAGSPALDMNINGTGFASGATASWIPAGGQPAPLLLSFKSSILLVATITAEQLRTGGSVQVTVKNPTGDPSLPGTFTIIAGPTINITNGLSPSSAPVNSAPVSLTVTGTGFVSTSKVRWNGTELTPTTVDSTTQLRATITLDLLKVAGPVPITVINSPTGTPSNAVIFNVLAGPTINTTNGLSPSSTSVNSPLTTLTVAGTGFISASKVRWNGTELVTIFDSITQLTATIPANLLTVVGSVPITVINSPTGTPSNAITFNVVAGPTINVTNGLSPVSTVVNSGPTTLTVNGTGFLATSRVRWNGSDLVTTFGSATQLSAIIPTNLLTTAGPAQVTVSNNGSISNSVTFTVTETIPTISTNGLSISSAPVNSPAMQITVTGTGFVPQSKVLWKGGELITMFDSATQLRANITLALLAIAGPAQVTVINSPTGTPSNVATFTVVSPTPVNFSTFTATTGTQPTLNLTLGAAATSKLTGTLDLTFAPASGVAGLPSVFVSKEIMFSNSSTTLPFTVDPGATTVAIPNSLRFSQGTVAGTVIVTMTSLSNSLGASVLPSPRPSASVVIDSAVPVTTSGSVKILNVTSSGFSVEVQGFTTTRDLTNATFVFTAGSGTQLDGSTTFTQPLTGTAPAWFSSTAGINGGGGFLLSMPFTFSGDTSALGNVSVTLSNSKGTSVSVNGGR